MEYHLYDTLKGIADNRKSTRSFAAREVSADLIDKILAVAHTSPYASGRKNWGVDVVNNRMVIEAAAAAVALNVTAMQSIVRDAYRNDFTRYAAKFSCFRSAPVVLVPHFRIAPSVTAMIENPDNMLLQWEHDSIVKSISCVAMLILLAVESLGLGACYITGALVAEKELIDLFHIQPGRRIGALIAIGYKTTEE